MQFPIVMKKQNLNKSVLLSATLILAASLSAEAMVTGKGTVRIEIQMSAEEKENLKKPERTDVPSAKVKIYEDGKLKEKVDIKLHSRGQSSLKEFARKNMEVKSIEEDEDKEKLNVGHVKAKEMILSSSPEDLLVTRNMLVYRLYEAVYVPTMETDYAEVVINGESQGLYMTSKSPAEQMIKKDDADIVIRRRYNDDLEFKKAKKSLSDVDIQAYEAQLKDIYALPKRLSGDDLVYALEKNFNLDHYFRWLAVNYVIKNGDYIDEVFFFAKKNKQNEMYFDIFPWDLDDSFAEKMKGVRIPFYANRGQEARSSSQFLFSFESRLDQAISQDPALLTKYFKVMEQVTNELSNRKVDQIFETVEKKLRPYLNDADILENGLLDSGKQVHDPIEIVAQMRMKKDIVKNRLHDIRRELDIIKTEIPGARAKGFNKLRQKIGFSEQRLLRSFSK